MIIIHATFPIDPDERERALELAADLVAETTEEPGAIEYHAATDLEDETVLRFVERYEDAAAFEAHADSEHFRSFADRLPELLDGEPEVMRFEVADAAELEL
ncbi:putative quinol monooxygenase [Halopenitus persicus]|uniref:Quinol monooxygenase YgiN n=1 Tax=Halopenitus persicus TaxID=1048396 RepID=A0A1H3E8P9_9EURY|nr:putative quinol monooxygenase [Halopenitus persicus]QHS17466.1 antibiotic biosynthesis monooxygenase [haloarchaeon 3A1-DGR]SDX75035.1 Quinol monooxygenase YgiN [Halopenitus persicus]